MYTLKKGTGICINIQNKSSFLYSICFQTTEKQLSVVKLFVKLFSTSLGNASPLYYLQDQYWRLTIYIIHHTKYGILILSRQRVKYSITKRKSEKIIAPDSIENTNMTCPGFKTNVFIPMD